MHLEAIRANANAKSDLSAIVEGQIRQRTAGRIGGLAVEAREGEVTVRGRARSFYLKQLAIQACLEALGSSPLRLTVAIDVPGAVQGPAS